MELATELERENNAAFACFVYSRIVQFPNIDQALKQEIASIIEEIKEGQGTETQQEVAATITVPNSILQSRKKRKTSGI